MNRAQPARLPCNGALMPKAGADSFRAALVQCETALCAVSIPFHRVHGDFFPQNICMCGGTMTVVNWEDSKQCGLPFYGAVYFALCVKRLLERKTSSPAHLLLDPLATLGVN